jgi:protein associated with RNAse G/E
VRVEFLSSRGTSFTTGGRPGWWRCGRRGSSPCSPRAGVFHHEGKGRRVVLDHDAYVAFFPGAWYSGGPDVREGRVLEYYWNVQTPAVWTGAGFRQYDLELDVRCRADHTCQVFDREEFLAKRPLYPEAWVARAEEAVEAIFRHVREGRWPVLPPGEPLPWMERL